MSLLNKPFIPCTPAGTPLVDLSAGTEEAAWRKLEKQLCPGMYRDRAALVARGYEVAKAIDGSDLKDDAETKGIAGQYAEGVES